MRLSTHLAVLRHGRMPVSCYASTRSALPENSSMLSSCLHCNSSCAVTACPMESECFTERMLDSEKPPWATGEEVQVGKLSHFGEKVPNRGKFGKSA